MADEIVVDEFDKAFAEAVAEVDSVPAAPPVVPPVEPPVVPPVEPPAVPPVEPPVVPPVEPPVVPPVEPPVVPPVIPPITPPAEPPVVPPAPVAPPAETPEAKTAREAFEASIKPYEPTAEEKVALEKFKADFPNEYQALDARLKSVDRDINARVYAAVQAVTKHYDPRLTSVEQTTATTAIERHFAALHTAHPDYDAVIEKVPAWIKTQPTYLQPALQAVYDSGTTQDVLALVTDFKKATGVAAPVIPPVVSPVVPPVVKPTDGADLAPVKTVRVTTLPKGTPDPLDFDGAWQEAVKALG